MLSLVSSPAIVQGITRCPLKVIIELPAVAASEYEGIIFDSISGKILKNWGPTADTDAPESTRASTHFELI